MPVQRRGRRPAAGAAGPWHFAHYAARAVGGTGLIIQEATAISPEGRISPYDLGIWNDTQVEALRPITAFLKLQGTVPGIQIAHAGRKASTERPWKGGRSVGPEEHGWLPDAPSALPFHEGDPIPHELTADHIREVIVQFADAARRSSTPASRSSRSTARTATSSGSSCPRAATGAPTSTAAPSRTAPASPSKSWTP